jgi:hypothetical protein
VEQPLENMSQNQMSFELIVISENVRPFPVLVRLTRLIGATDPTLHDTNTSINVFLLQKQSW